MAASELETKYLHLIEAQKKLITFYHMNGKCTAPVELTMAVEEAERALIVFTSPYSLPEYRPMPLLTDSIDPMRVDQNVFLPPCLRGNISNGVTGLVNMGNTCFVNSTMQALMATEWLRNRILSMKPETSTPQPITGVIERFARCFWDNKVKSKSSVALPTSSIVHALPPWLGGFRQQDAQEFLIWLLDIMRDEAKAVIKANRDPVACSDRSRKAASQVPSRSDNCSLELTRKMADTWIDEIFGNLSVSTVTCSHCRATTEKYESNLMISLEIPLSRFKLPLVASRTTPSIRIQDCLDEYFNEHEPEKIDDFACLNCTLIDRVTRAASAAQTVLLQQLPGLPDPLALSAEAGSLLSRCKEANLLKLEGQIAALLQIKDRSLDKAPLFQMQETLRRVQNKLDRLETTICLLQAGDRSIIHPGSDLVSTLFHLIQSLQDILVEIDVISEIVAYMHASASGLSPKTPPLITRPAFRKLSLQQQPGCLILQIKRFQMTAYSSVKLQHIISLAPEIDLAPYLTPDYTEALASGLPCASTRYQLFAVVEHQGQLSSGHYIAYVQKPTGWFRCSDSYVTPATVEQVLRSDAYLLFYQRF